MNREEFEQRTKKFALDVFRFCDTLPRGWSYRIIARQLMRSASSVGANYRAACRAQSRAAFLAKLALVEEEADESLFWLEMIEGLGFTRTDEFRRLKDEADQLIAITVASKKTTRRKL